MNNIPRAEDTKGKKTESKNLHKINGEITCSPVLLVVPEGENRVLELEEALQMARSAELDLVLINERAKTPVVKILDYGKYLYEIKKQKSDKKNVVKIKSITVKPQISSHDISWKADKAKKWFQDGDNVEFLVRATGRMSDRIDLINEVFESFAKLVEDFGKPRDKLKKISKIQYATHFVPVKK